MRRRAIRDAAGLTTAGIILAGCLLTAVILTTIMGVTTGALKIASGAADGRNRKKKEKA